MNSLLLTFIIAVIFYILIPGIGGFHVRNQWRVFRKRIIEASKYPRISYGIVRSGKEGYLGKFRFFGSLEAIQENRIWVRDRRISLRADLSGCSVYVLPTSDYSEGYSDEEAANGSPDGVLSDEEPQRISWNKIFSLPEGTKMFISGPLFLEKGRRIFHSEKGNPLTVVIYDGPESSILRRSIWSGRQKNEYWNSFTPMSVTAGSFGLFIHAYTLFRDPMLRFSAIVTLTVSLLPVVIFLPPGILLFFLYRRLWNRGRYLRAERDLLQLPLRYFPAGGNGKEVDDEEYRETALPDGQRLAMKRVEKNEEDITALCFSRPIKRSSSLLEKGRHKFINNHYYIVGTPVGEGTGIRLKEPEDPMAEYLLIPGNPAVLSAECARRAHLYEITAAVVFTVGLLLNVSIVFIIFTILLK